MQRLACSLVIMFATLVSAIGFAENQNQQIAKNQNQQVAQYIADQLSSKFPEYTIHVKYNSGVVTLVGELYDNNQIEDALGFVRTLPGVTRVINGMNLVQAKSAIQPISVSQDMRRNVGMNGTASQSLIQNPSNSTITAAVPQGTENSAVSAAVVQRIEPNAITQVRGQVDNRPVTGVTDFTKREIPATPAPTIPVPEPTITAQATPIAPVAPSAPALTPTPIPTLAPLAPASYIDDRQAPAPSPITAASGNNLSPFLPQNISTETQQVAVPYDSQMPLPIGQQVATAGRYDQPNVPNYAWPAYAAPNNVSQVAYPRLYCPDATPYIGPFNPYPQVPTGWRKVTLEWHDGYWWLDFDDGSAHGPFSPLFRHPNPKRR
ncbi:MAG: BON domain-containing protein [Planctomycetaceae bacterium]|nr:BON domain-containing protein [Planctomycetaceae bacterium]